jgi:hypothetical protein
MANETFESTRAVDTDPGRSTASHFEGSTGGGISQAIRDQASATWSDTKDKARSTLADQQQAAADGIGDLAQALHSAAGDLGRKDRTTVSHFAEEAANGLERLSQTLRGKDIATMVKEAEAYARREPALFLGAAVAAGFLAMRFLKSSSESARARTAVKPSSERIEIAHSSDDLA